MRSDEGKGEEELLDLKGFPDMAVLNPALAVLRDASSPVLTLIIVENKKMAKLLKCGMDRQLGQALFYMLTTKH